MKQKQIKAMKQKLEQEAKKKQKPTQPLPVVPNKSNPSAVINQGGGGSKATSPASGEPMGHGGEGGLPVPIK